MYLHWALQLLVQIPHSVLVRCVGLIVDDVTAAGVREQLEARDTREGRRVARVDVHRVATL